MAFIDTADAPQPIGRGLVVEVAGQRVARIGGHRQHPTLGQQVGRPPQQSQLRVFRMDLEELGHGQAA
jgi:hypothetical protein